MTYPHVLANLAFMLPSAESVEKVIDGWKMSNDEASTLRWMFASRRDDRPDFEFELDLIRGVPRDNVVALLTRSDRKDLAERLKVWEIPVFPVTGQDLIDAGFKPGPEFGVILGGLKMEWFASGYAMTKEQMLPYARMYV